MISSREANIKIQQNILKGTKVPHNTSYPVIYSENGKYYLAVFVTFYNQEDINAAKLDRPSLWAIADIETAEIIEERKTTEKEFSDAAYDTKYDISKSGNATLPENYFIDSFDLLDVVRTAIIYYGRFDYENYQKYLNRIVSAMPKEYGRFYIDLSVDADVKRFAMAGKDKKIKDLENSLLRK